jgi:hypothetical protein
VATKCEANNYHKWGLALKKNRKKLRSFLRNQQSLSVQIFLKLKACSTALIIVCRLDGLFKRKNYSTGKIRVEYSILFRIYFHHWKPVDYFVKCEIWHPKYLLSTHVLHLRIHISPPTPTPKKNPLFLNCFFPILRILVSEMECLSCGRNLLKTIIKLISDVKKLNLS